MSENSNGRLFDCLNTLMGTTNNSSIIPQRVELHQLNRVDSEDPDVSLNQNHIEYNKETVPSVRPLIGRQVLKDPSIFGFPGSSQKFFGRMIKFICTFGIVVVGSVVMLILLVRRSTSDDNVIAQVIVRSTTKKVLPDTLTVNTTTEFFQTLSPTVLSSRSSFFPKPSDYIEITSVDDFRHLDFEPANEAIVINSLVDAPDFDLQTSSSVYNDNGDSNRIDSVIKQPERIKYIQIKGPTSNLWLSFLLERCNQVVGLTLDVNQLCSASKVRGQKWDLLQAITLTHLRYLRIINSSQCSIISWIFRWTLPNLQQLEISDVNLENRTFVLLSKFVVNHANSLISVVISNSFVCSGCEIDSALLDQVDIKIKDELQEPMQ